MLPSNGASEIADDGEVASGGEADDTEGSGDDLPLLLVEGVGNSLEG